MKRKFKYLVSNGCLVFLVYQSQEAGWYWPITVALSLFLALSLTRAVVNIIFLSWIRADPEQLKDEVVVRSVGHTIPAFGLFLNLVFDAAMVGMIYVYMGQNWTIVWIAGALFNVLADGVSRETQEYCEEATESS